MPSSRPTLRSVLAALTALTVLASPARAYDPERDAWLRPESVPQTEVPRRPVDPLEFARIRATGNDQEPEYAGGDQLALLEAVRQGDRAQVEQWLGEGVNANGRPDLWGKTVLLEAVERGDVEMVRLLLEAGAAPDLKSGGFTPLGRAALLGHARIVRLLLRAGANPDLKSNDGNTPLTAAAGQNRVEALRALLTARPDPSLFNLEGRTALSVAALEGFDEAVRVLLEGGVSPNLRDKNGGGALNSAISGDHAAVLELLVRHGASTQ